VKKQILFLVFLFSLESGFGFSKKVSCRGSNNLEFKEAFQGKLSLEKQNFVVNLWKLERFEEEKDVELAVQSKKLVSVPRVTNYYFVDPRLDKKTYFIRPWTLNFIEQFAKDFYLQTQSHKKWHKKKIELTSFVRDRKYQKLLVKRNPNAVNDKGDPMRQSSHLTGATFDFSTRGMSKEEICWVKTYLLEQQKFWFIHARDEFYNNCFHIMVFPVPTYTGDVK